MGVTKIIHQTYKTYDSIPEKWKASELSWKKWHPDWEYKFWSDEDLRNLIETEYNWFLPTYDFYPYFIQRVDAARYFILDKYGGLYSDLDWICNGSIEPYITGNEEIYLIMSHHVKNCATNSLMYASRPKASFWQHVKRELLRQPPWWGLTKHMIIMNSTGPMLINRVLFNYSNSTVGILPVAHFGKGTNPNQYVITSVKGESWCSLDSTIFTFINKHKEFFATVGIAAIIFGIITIVYLTIVYKTKKHEFQACEMSVKKLNRKIKNLENF